MANLGISYMGSKRKLASRILNVINSRHHGITDFYDLFGGGGAISFNAINDYNFKVHYNELNTHIYSLVQYLKTNKTLEPKFYEWVTREEFFKQCNREDADWYSGFVMSCWSFGNKQSSYIYGADIENIKRLGHEFIVNNNLDAMREIGINIDLSNINDLQKRRTVFCKYIKKSKTLLEDNRVQKIELVEHLARIQNLQNLQNIQNIQNPQNIQNIQNLQITNKSYEQINITGANPVIYCDIPYKGTGEYKEGGFNHEKFYQWVKDNPYPVYISEYSTPFEMVEMFSHRSSLSSTNNKKKTVESVFWNGKGDVFETKLF